MKFPDLTIMRRIVGPFVLLILVGNMVVVTLMLNSLEKQLLSRQQRHLRQQLSQYAENLGKEFENFANMARFLAKMPSLQELHAEEGETALELQLDAANRKANNGVQHFEAVSRSVFLMTAETTRLELVTANGEVALALERDSQGQTREDFDRAAKTTPRMLPQRTHPITADMRAASVEVALVPSTDANDPSWVIQAVAPVVSPDGDVFAHVILQRRLPQASRPELVDSTFRLADQGGVYLGPSVRGKEASLFETYPGARASLATTPLWNEGMDAEHTHVTVVQKLNYDPNDSEKYLYVVGESSHAQATRLRQDLLGTVYLAVVIVGLFSSFIALAIAWKIAEPIVRMRDAVVRKGIRTQDTELPLNVGGEVGELAQSVRQFLAEIRKREEQLQHEILQRKVALAHLEVKNDMLEFANQESEQFVYIASHDLQEPVRTVKSFVHMLQTEYQDKLDDNGRQILTFLENSTTRMTELIKGLLEYSRLGKNGELSTVDVQDLVKGVCDDLALRIREKGASVEYANLPTVIAYATELRALLQNLIGNALKFTRADVPPVVKIQAEQQGEEWLFSIEDNGIGIAEEHYEKIFMIFQRLHGREGYEGSGIGLAHCKKIIEMHGGKIWLQSTPGEGTKFFFTLRNPRDGVDRHLEGNAT